jgi:hypothetical protein
MSSCDFSADRVFRYVLRHECGDLFAGKPRRIAWIGINPSTADESTLDQTMEAVRRYSKKWEFSEIVMLNLFAFRATDPAIMKKATDPVGPDNDRWLVTEAKTVDRVIACWGNPGAFLNRDQQVCSLLSTAGIGLQCLRKNADGSPHHPLYLGPDIEPIPFP